MLTLSCMNQKDDAVAALMEIGAYLGTTEQFLHESATRIRIKLNCSGSEATQILNDLRERAEVDFEMRRGDALRADESTPLATWNWFIPRR
jgi:hypothetical protein